MVLKKEKNKYNLFFSINTFKTKIIKLKIIIEKIS